MPFEEPSWLPVDRGAVETERAVLRFWKHEVLTAGDVVVETVYQALRSRFLGSLSATPCFLQPWSCVPAPRPAARSDPRHVGRG